MTSNREKGTIMRTSLFFICCALAFRLDAAIPQPSDSQKIILTYPNSGESFTVGDTVSVKWVCIDDIMFVDIYLSANKGKTWILLNAESISYEDTARWRHFKWRIPAKITSKPGVEFSLADNHDCLFRVESYSPKDKSEISASAKPVTILAGSGVINANDQAKPTAPFIFNKMLSGGFTPESFLNGLASIKLFDLRGKVLLIGKRTAPGLIVCAKPGLWSRRPGRSAEGRPRSNRRTSDRY